ncbi:MAG UNVERIFIED_CONTAM: hypothetical protein LVT10_11945 [Anaerolineae bacterium]
MTCRLVGTCNSALVPVLSGGRGAGRCGLLGVSFCSAQFCQRVGDHVGNPAGAVCPCGGCAVPSETSPTTLVIATDLLRLTAPALSRVCSPF